MLLDGYIRVSQVKGRRGERFIAPQVQREEIGRWISANGAALGEMFEELDESGGRADRPLLMEAVSRIEEGVSDGIVVAKLTRFGRSTLDGLTLIARIQDAGGTLVSVQQGFDLRTSTGQLVTQILFAVAEWELDQWREHWNAARSRAIGRGVHICRRAPIGYRRTDSGRLRIEPNEAAAVREVFKRRLAGERCQELVDFLNDSEFETESGVPFTLSSIYKILKNPVYRGAAHSGAYSNPNAHEAIVDPASWQECQFRERPAPEQVQSLLAGMIRCASCGRRMTAIRPAIPRGNSDLYRCNTGRCAEPAQARNEELDPLVEEFIFRRLGKGRPRSRDLETERREAAVETAKEDLVSYRDNIGLQRTLGPESFEAGLAKRGAAVERALLELARARRGRRQPKPDLGALEQSWPGMNWQERREALGELIDFVVVKRGSGPVIERAWIFRRGEGPVVSGPQRRIEAFKPPRGGTAKLRKPRCWPAKRIETELGEFLDEGATWPTYLEFAGAGRAQLHAQAYRYGGPYYWGQQLGIKIRPSSVRWSQARVRDALAPFLAGREKWPTRREFTAAGLSAVREAAINHGGIMHWAEQFGLPHSPRPRRRWPPEQIEAELKRLIDERELFPSRDEFIAADLDKLYAAVLRHGGIQYWASRLGLSVAAGRLDRR